MSLPELTSFTALRICPSFYFNDVLSFVKDLKGSICRYHFERLHSCVFVRDEKCFLNMFLAVFVAGYKEWSADKRC